MPVQIVLDHPNTIWTNFDQIIGKAALRLDSQSSITSIVVKLEGESRTKLVASTPTDMDRRPRPFEEFHKVRFSRALCAGLDSLTKMLVTCLRLAL